MTTIQSAGYIVCDNAVIWGYGRTEDEAWDLFLAEMGHANVEVVTEVTNEQFENGGWTRESDYHICAASAALLARVEDVGGNVAWRVRNGVACTVAEDEVDES